MLSQQVILGAALTLLALSSVNTQRPPQFNNFQSATFGNSDVFSTPTQGDQSSSSLQQDSQPLRPQQQEQSAPLQLSRPSLSASSLSAPQSQQQPRTSSSQVVASSAQQPSRQQRPKPQVAAAASSPVRQPLQTQQTSQSLQARSSQASIENARKSEANAASLAAQSGQSYQCPEPFGFFRHHKSCDKYYACENGTATTKLCGNGLMFDDSDPKRENCAYPFSVDCGDRTELEAPISTSHCPRLYGLFQDNSNCRIFYSCWNGEASKYECPPGLAYDSEQRVCVWADHVDRCDQSEVSDGFVCPDATEVDQPGHYTRHAHPTDCRKFYVCIEGVARPYGCSLGSVFNIDSLQCDDPDNVSGCEKYYGDTLEPKLAKKLARESIQGQSPNQPKSSSSSSSRRGQASVASNTSDNQSN